MEILQHIWGSTPEGEGIILYTMRNERGSEVQLCNIGASIVGVKFADRKRYYSAFDSFYHDNDPEPMINLVAEYVSERYDDYFRVLGDQNN